MIKMLLDFENISKQCFPENKTQKNRRHLTLCVKEKRTISQEHHINGNVFYLPGSNLYDPGTALAVRIVLSRHSRKAERARVLMVRGPATCKRHHDLPNMGHACNVFTVNWSFQSYKKREILSNTHVPEAWISQFVPVKPLAQLHW